MKTKTIIAFVLLTLLAANLFLAVAATQPDQQAKGGSKYFGDVSRGKPSKPSTGIATGTVSESTGSRYAIIIGISDYSGTINDLTYCDDDAVEFKNALIDSGWSTGKDHITLLVDADAKHDVILAAIAEVSSNAKAGDEVVFFYSGHGSISNFDIDGDGERRDECIIPYECSGSTFIWDGDLQKAFADCKSQRMMFFFDSCYAGGMTDLAGAGRLVCMACGENQLSLESSLWQNGQFSYYFVDQGMANGLADKNGDFKVTFEEAFDYAKANCLKQSPVASDEFLNDMLP